MNVEGEMAGLITKARIGEFSIRSQDMSRDASHLKSGCLSRKGEGFIPRALPVFILHFGLFLFLARLMYQNPSSITPTPLDISYVNRVSEVETQKREPGHLRAAASLSVMVNVKKARLRLGPSFEDGILLEIGKGAVLHAESLTGEWYEVFTPTGYRTYIHESVVKEVEDEIHS